MKIEYPLGMGLILKKSLVLQF